MGIPGTEAPALPKARGPVSAYLASRLTAPAPAPTARPSTADAGAGADAGAAAGVETGDPWAEDLQLALYICYELHYRGFAQVDPRWEWDPSLLALRARLEDRFLDAVRAELGPVTPLQRQLDALLVEPESGTGPSYFLLEHGDRGQAREYLAQRSLYHLKEADPQAFAIPRLHGRAQAALVAIEFDEYGAGRPTAVHSRLFADMMDDLGLDPTYGAYLPAASAQALAVVNLMSLFGLHRELRGALVGQFAGVEITSSPGARRLAAALERLGASARGTRFYREHIEADAVHEQLVRREVIGALLEDEPELEQDIAFGLAASELAERRLADHAVSCWRRGASSLRVPLGEG